MGVRVGTHEREMDDLPFTTFTTENSLTRLRQNLNAADLYGQELASAGDYYDHHCFNQATITDLLHVQDDELTPTWRQSFNREIPFSLGTEQSP